MSQRKEWSRFASRNNNGGERYHPRVEIAIRNLDKDTYIKWEDIKAHYQIDGSIDVLVNRFVVNHIILSNGKRLHDAIRIANELVDNIDELKINHENSDEITTDIKVGDKVYLRNKELEFESVIVKKITHRLSNDNRYSSKNVHTFADTDYHVSYVSSVLSNIDDPVDTVAVKWENLYRNTELFYQWYKLIEIQLEYVDKYIMTNDSGNVDQRTFVTHDYEDCLTKLSNNIRSGVTPHYNSLSYNTFVKNILDRTNVIRTSCKKKADHYRVRRATISWWERMLFNWTNFTKKIEPLDIFVNNTLHSFKEEVAETLEKYKCLKDNLLTIKKYLRHIKVKVRYGADGTPLNSNDAKIEVQKVIKLVTHVHTRILGDYGIS